MARPALSSGGGTAPKITTRLPRQVDARLRDIARRQGRTPSVLLREAIDRLIAEADAGPPGKAA